MLQDVLASLLFRLLEIQVEPKSEHLKKSLLHTMSNLPCGREAAEDINQRGGITEQWMHPELYTNNEVKQASSGQAYNR